jgi:hypothetical protein
MGNSADRRLGSRSCKRGMYLRLSPHTGHNVSRRSHPSNHRTRHGRPPGSLTIPVLHRRERMVSRSGRAQILLQTSQLSLIRTDSKFVPYQEQLGLYENFIVKLESFMGISRTDVNITSAWAETSNISQSLNAWASPIYYDMNNVTFHLINLVS